MRLSLFPMTISSSQFSKFTRSEIQQLFKQAKSCGKHPFIDIRCAPRTKDYARLLLILPRKIGNAVVRNKLRRRLKAIFYEERLFEQPKDVMVFAKPGSATMSFQELKSLLLSAVQHSPNHSAERVHG